MLRTAHVATAAVVVFVAFAAWILSGVSQGTALSAVDDIVFVVLAIPAITLAAMAARSTHGRLRMAWIAMAIGLLGWALGDSIWTYYELVVNGAPFPSIADAAYLVMPVAFCVALLLFPAEDSARFRGRMLLDGLIVAGSLFLASWVTILNPLYQAGGDDTLAFVISLAYPISDVVILTIAAIAAIRAAPEQRLVLGLITAAMACIALSDSAFAYLSAKAEYSSGSVIDIGWVAGLLLITVAAAAGRETPHHKDGALSLPGWASIWFPYAPLLLAGVVAAAEPPEMFQTPLVEIVGALVVATVLARQFLAVSDNRRLLKVVAEQALRDPLTGLGNRAMFSERLNQAMQQRAREQAAVGLIALDLNDFKLVNDAMGHPAGDELLNRVGERVLGCVRNSDTVARLGGDEFVVLVEGEANVADHIARRVVESFDKPFVIENREVFIRPSVGLAVADIDQPALTAEDLLKQADVAMYAAKKSRTAAVQRFGPEMPATASLDDGLFNRLGAMSVGSEHGGTPLLAELRQAIDQFELTLLYQPKFDVRTSRIVGVEALVRWPHPERGLLGPDEFLPLVRRHGLMGSITDLVINMALDEAVRFQRVATSLPVAVNVSAPLFADPHLPARIARALADRDLSASVLCLEITEDLLLGNMEKTQTVLEELRRNGIRIAIDDFGSGYSTLSYLCELPVDEVKLDRKLVASVVEDARVATVVRHVVDLAHELGLITVAEGVEDAEAAARVAALGCDVVQGFYFSPPLAPAALVDLLQSCLRDHSAAENSNAHL
ncbi:bifunctional diguanylate cyclase/phosphodiesterase [Mycobacterium sp. NBC_00419]|uniref:putative bifunctional diguanylate cyclase/phosphodiesterase n=1 Tax=Mycobacterium sp. NBC_00419 TaxID=2975989 RepID=UPI002E205B81